MAIIYKLGDVCYYVEGYVNPPINDETNFVKKNGFPWLKVSSLNHGGYINDSGFYLSKKSLEGVVNKNQLFRKGTIVWSKSGSVGNCSILNIDCFANRGLLNIINNQKLVKNKFLFYFLCKNKNLFSKKSIGAVLKHFYGPNLMNEFIELPSLKIQQKIIDIIEPIENLKKIVLEFSNKLNAFLIELPEEKKYFTFFDVAILTKNKKRNLSQISAKVLQKKNPLIFGKEGNGTYKSNVYFSEKGTLLITTIRTYLEKFGILPFDSDYNGTLMALKINNKETAILHSLLTKSFWLQANNLSKGTKMPVISKNDLLHNIKMVDVSLEINSLFSIYCVISNLINSINLLIEKFVLLLIK